MLHDGARVLVVVDGEDLRAVLVERLSPQLPDDLARRALDLEHRVEVAGGDEQVTRGALLDRVAVVDVVDLFTVDGDHDGQRVLVDRVDVVAAPPRPDQPALGVDLLDDAVGDGRVRMPGGVGVQTCEIDAPRQPVGQQQMVAVRQLLQLMQVGGIDDGVGGVDVCPLLGVEVVDVVDNGRIDPETNLGRGVHVGDLVLAQRGDVDRRSPVRLAVPDRRPVGVEDHRVGRGSAERPGQVPAGGGRARLWVGGDLDVGEVVRQAADPVLRLPSDPVGGGDDRGVALGQLHGVEAGRLGLGRDGRHQTRLAP